jgi:hypothetical protein
MVNPFKDLKDMKRILEKRHAIVLWLKNTVGDISYQVSQKEVFRRFYLKTSFSFPPPKKKTDKYHLHTFHPS